jgi:serine/threonine protein kinase
MANHVMREIAAIKSIDCPQIISVLGCFWVDDFTYAMVFPLYRCDLKSHLGAPLALHEIRRIAKELACALYRLHLKGFVHRDIKPSNILIGHCGEVVLTDFGTVKCGRI